MLKFHKKNSQNAQGMVEFALVLPVLLLLILGIIAFGHLFFVYSFTVAASREAARWGSAVGVTGSGLPRFRDCDAILDSAVRVGGMAGVRPENTVIEYDHGPDSAAYADCPAGGEGPDVTLSDRILVTVNVNYTPIVPLVNIPDIPLSATTARTIIRGLPVGEAPTIAPSCISTFFEITSTSLPLDVGQTETFNYIVKSSGPDQPTTGRVTIKIGSDTKVNNSPSLSGSFTHIFNTHGDIQLTATFDSTNYKFCSINPPSMYTFKVRRETVTKIILDQPDPSAPDEGVTVKVIVGPKVGVLPAGTAPTGVVLVYDKDIVSIGCQINALDPDGTGSCLLPGYPALGVRNLVARYQGDIDFTPSPVSAAEPHTVVGVIPPTMIPSPTPVPSPTPMPICPMLITAFNFTDQSDGFWISVQNPDSTPALLYSIKLTWPAKSGIDAQLKEVRFAPTTTASCNPANPSAECIWVGPNPLAPTSQEIGGTTSNHWSGPAELGLPAGATNQMRFVFTSELPNTKSNGTKYSLTLEFEKSINGERCKIVVPNTNRNIE